MLANWTFAMFLEPQPRGRILDNSPLVPGLKKESLRRTEAGFEVMASQPSYVSAVEPGDRLVQFSRSPGAEELFGAERCPDTTFLRVVNHSTSGGHYLLLECDAARILHCTSMPGEGRGYGGNADGAHVRSSTVGPWIEGCYFEAVGDDSVAIYAKGIAARSQPAADRVVLDAEFFNLAPGNKFMVFNPREGTPVGEPATVVTVEDQPAISGGRPAKIVTFSPPLDAALKTDFPDPWNNDQAFNLSARNRGFVVRRNTFRDIRRYGVIARAEEGAIEENHIVGTSDSAITLQNEPNVWRNGLHSVGIRIANNLIEHCNFTTSARDRGTIHITLRAIKDPAQRWGEKLGGWKGHRDITITGNSIDEWRGCAISLQNIDGLVLTNNRIVGQRPSLPGIPPLGAVFLNHVAGAAISGNIFEGLQPGTAEIAQGEDVGMAPAVP
jgi:hypothetical protein